MALHTWTPFCHDFYGGFARDLSPRCELALAKMPMDHASEVYEINAARPIGPYNLPVTYTDDHCEFFFRRARVISLVKDIILYLHLLTF